MKILVYSILFADVVLGTVNISLGNVGMALLLGICGGVLLHTARKHGVI